MVERLEVGEGEAAQAGEGGRTGGQVLAGQNRFSLHPKSQIFCYATTLFNLRDFPSAALSAHGLRAEPLDAFLSTLLRDHPQEVITALARQRHRLLNPS